MLLLLGLLQVTIFIILFRKALTSHPNFFYVAAVGVIIFLAIYGYFGLSAEWPEWTYTYVISSFYRGAFSTALFIVIMYTGALNNKLTLTKKLMRVRTQLSILACILTLGHNLIYGYVYFPLLFTNPGSVPLHRLIAGYISVVLLLIMLPLMITSFPKVRRKMKAKQWKKLQRWAYLFYFLIYAHVMVLFVPYINKEGYGSYYRISVLVYSAIFGVYAVLRLRKFTLSKKNNKVVMIKAGEIS